MADHEDRSTSTGATAPAGAPIVFVGLDVGKSAHHVVGLLADRRKVLDEGVLNDEAAIRLVLNRALERGQILVVVDEPASIGALPLAVARAMAKEGHAVRVGYLPGLTMRRLADLHAGHAKTDARDAFVIADAARSLPHTLRHVDLDDDTLTGLSVLVGYDDDLAAESTRLANRLRGALLQVSPALERAFGAKVMHPAVLALLGELPIPARLRAAGPGRIRAVLDRHARRGTAELTDKVMAALAAQHVITPGTDELGQVIVGLTRSLTLVLQQRQELAVQVETRLAAHPLGEVLTSMPGVGVRTAARMLATIGDASAFSTAAQLAAYAGLAPVTRQSGTSIKGERHNQRGHRALKTALYMSAFASLSDPTSRAYYDRKRAEGKRHSGALICLARRRLDVQFAMLRNGKKYVSGGPVTPTNNTDEEIPCAA